MADRRRQRWIREINYGLIDVLDMWILCLDAGMSFQGALARVAQDLELARPALRQELQVTLQEMLAGCPRDEALKHLARRCDGAGEMSALVAHIIQAEKMGSSVTKTLQVCANSLRFNRYQDMRQWVLGIPVKLAFPLIFCILPCLLIIISAPALLRMYEVLSRQ
jgi:tight adherence protein C